MPTMTTPQEIAAAIESALDGGGHLVIRFGHSQMRQLKLEEVELLVASLKAPTPEGGVFISLEMLRFLHGADALHGVWFGEAVGTRGRYWWRKELPPIPEPSPSAAQSDGKKEE